MRWFKHFSNAHNDNALNKVRMRFGADGYAIYWYCLELIAGDLEGENASFELSHDAEVIGFNLKVDQLRVEEIIRYMVDLKLFESANNKITCLKMAKFLDKKSTRNSEIHKIIDSFNELQIVADKSGIVADIPKHLRLDEKRREENKYIAPIGADLLKAWMLVRKAKKAGEVTELVFKGLHREALKAGLTDDEAVTICCERSWISFKADWVIGGTGLNKTLPSKTADFLNGMKVI